MDEFIIDEDLPRDYALSCTLRPQKFKRIHHNRKRVLERIEKKRITGQTQIGQYTRGHMKRFNDPDMREYFRLLKRSRIVVTCNPYRWEGDHRIWEGLANGALMFIDKMYFPLSHPLVDGEHCIFYEISNDGLEILSDKIDYYLSHRTTARKIATKGHEFAMKYHRTSNRIDEILEVIT